MRFKLVILLLLTALANPNFSFSQDKKPEVPQLFAVIQNGKWGFIDNTGKIIVEPKFEEVKDFNEGMCGVKIDGKWGFINDKGKLVIDAVHEGVNNFYDGMAKITKKDPGTFSFTGKCGYIDKTGKIVVDIIFEDGLFVDNFFSEGLCVFEKNDKYGFINKSGKVVIEAQYDWANAFHDGVASVKFGGADGSYGIINQKGEWVLRPMYYSITKFTNGVAGYYTQKEGKAGILDKKGKALTEPKYKLGGFWIWNFTDGLASVAENDKYGFIDNTGKVIIPLKYTEVSNFSEGLCAASLDGTVDGTGLFKKVTGGWGFIDKTGKTVIAHKFESVNGFSEGLAAAQMDGLWGFIDKQGRWVITPQFKDSPYGFKNGIARVNIREGDSWLNQAKVGYINKKGVMVWDPQK